MSDERRASTAPRKTLIRNAAILTMDEGSGDLDQGDLLIEGDTIAAIGRRLDEPADEVVDAAGMILMPGMVDSHRHVWEAIDMGGLVKVRPAPYLPAYQQWKMRTIVSMTPEDHYLAELVGGLQAIDSGVTAVVDYAHGQISEAHTMAAARGLRDAGIGGWFAFQLGVAPSYKPGDTISLAAANRQRIARPTAAHWATAERLQSELFHDSSAPLQLAVAPCGNNGTPLDEIRDEWSRIRGMGIQFMPQHIHKPEKPHPPGVMGHRGSGIEDLADAGLLGPDFQAVHANALTTAELDLMREAGSMLSATTMAEFPYVLYAQKGAPIHAHARNAGVPAGIGVDVPVSLTSEYFEHVRSAYWTLYLDAVHPGIVANCTSPYVLDFATRLGAQSVRLGHRTGVLAAGKRADLVLLSTRRIGFGMAGTLAERVLTFAGTADVDSVWVAGTARKRHGRMIGVDWDELKNALAEAQRRIARLAATIQFT